MIGDGFSHVSPLRSFIGYSQRRVLAMLCEGEEGEFFQNRLAELRHLIDTMPKTYEQSDKEGAAVVYLHYFMGGCDWYITEKDKEREQLQAFGLADLGYGGELGYISLVEVLQCGAELDLHWTPKTLDEVRASRRVAA
ncbi:DUF2958 domain-containing protein [Dyella ginsengisoli]|uniref:DUF2958 domain-containing protein n=1 Tax=Dyella ginsengisoli TaxID=363848 RepID=UPI00034C52DA|nr:DUF2958 domain-containing protein [Dyella ginsengisoli]